MTTFTESQNGIFNSWGGDMYSYLDACEFHDPHIDLSNFGSNTCDLHISKYPLAHNAQRARFTDYFQVSLQSIHNSNHLYIIQFFVQPKFKKDASGDNCLLKILRIMEMNLMKSFKFASGGHLLEEILALSRQPIAIECGSIECSNVLKSYREIVSESDFTTVDSCFLRPSENRRKGWAFRLPVEDRLGENDRKKIENIMKQITFKAWKHYNWIVQFWAPKVAEGGRCYLQTLDQPYAVGCLSKGIASFRKKCTTHYYFVDDEAKEDELGPPGRVFRNGNPEFTPDLFHYSRKEFSIRDYAMHCFSHCRGYFALPIFDDDDKCNHECAGVLEFLGFYGSDLEDIGGGLKAANLPSTHIGFHPRFLAYEQAFSTIYCRREALAEVNNALTLIYVNIPRLHKANVWVDNAECIAIQSNTSCMELALSTNHLGKFMPADQVNCIHVQNKKGVVGMVLAYENKSCFCQNLSEFGIADQPLSHYDMTDRHDVCFTICLQSSLTRDLVYVFEFFLYQGPTTYAYLQPFLNFLLPIMKCELSSFKMASGKELGDELVVELIEFSDANKLGSSESEEADLFPFKFKIVQYSQDQEHQPTQEECSIVATDSERRSGGKRKPRHNLSLELLLTVSHKTEKAAAEYLGVALSTPKRACRRLGKTDWRDIARDMLPSTSNIQPLDASFHPNVTLITNK